MHITASTDNLTLTPPWTRPDRSLVDRMSGVSAANVGDALGRLTVLDGGIQRYAGRDPLLGVALPVDVRAGDNLAVHRAVDDAQPGDVLVINSHGDTTRAIIGDLMGEIMISAGITGAVVDGAIRDVAALTQQGLSVYARAITPAGPFKHGPGSIGKPVAVGGVVVSAGDLIVGDEDGVVVVPRDQIAEVADLSETVVRNEEELRRRILDARLAPVEGS